MTVAPAEATAWFESVLGPSGILEDADAEPYLQDWRRQYRGSVIAVLRPNSADQVAQVVQFCSANGISIITQGGNTGLSGGATPDSTQRAVVLSTRRLAVIESTDARRGTITAQAGVTIGAVQAAASGVGMMFAPDWGARDSATVGGAISTNAGGMNVIRYGSFRDQVLGLQVVLASGRIWDGRRALPKDASGYDMKQLFIGAEGTLGVVTSAVLKLHPQSIHHQTAVGALAGRDQIAPLLVASRTAVPGGPSAIELMPQAGVQRICSHLKVAAPFSTDAIELVLMKFDATEPVTEPVEHFLHAMISTGVLLDATLADSAARADQLWNIRDLMSSTEIFPTLDRGLKFDTAVPADQIADYLDEVQAIVVRLAPGSFTHAFGHIGDGNIHVRVAATGPDAQSELDTARDQLTAAIDHATLAREGTLSAEHGIGRALRKRVQPQKSDIEWELMHTVKQALDPYAVFNPDIMLPLKP